MARTGKITLKEGIGKNSGKPFVALKLEVGKWSKLHFPTQFEKDYLVEYLKEHEGTITIDRNTNNLYLVAGDYISDYKVDSQFELKYISQWFRDGEAEAAVASNDDDKLDLSKEDELNTNPFGN